MKKVKEYFSNMNFYKFVFLLQTIGLILMFAFCSPISTYAASEPTYFPMAQNGNNRWTTGLIGVAETQANASENYYIARLYWNQSAARSEIALIYWPKNSELTFDGRIYNTNQWQIYKHGSGSYIYKSYWHSWQNTAVNSLYSRTNEGMSNVTGFSSLADNRYSYISNINVMNGEAPRSAILWFEIPTYVPDPGTLEAPDMSSLDLDSNLNTSTVPTTPTYSNNFNDPIPTWDTTAPFQSLFDIIVWGFDRAYSMFEAFREYLFSWFGYFVSILTYLIQKIIDAIKYIVTWFYNQFLNWLTPYLNIVKFIAGLFWNEDDQIGVLDILTTIKEIFLSFVNTYFPPDFSPITDKIEDFMTAFNSLKNLFTADPNYSFIYNTFIGTYLGQVYVSGNNLLTAIITMFREIQAPQTLTFSVNFTTAPSPFNSVGVLSFDFGWYNSIRSVIEPIIVTCLYIGVGLHILSSIRSVFSDSAALTPDTKTDPIHTPAMNNARAQSRARANAVRARHRK